ncbi:MULTISPECIES: MerR family transcriptional regulator [unclassified Psychrobacter]|uniref:MerR family transcriptional regulator n=1 Tax=unclassified Psychrobacter TaxID=196806 RepID=UPI0025E8C766|nr:MULTISPECIES: MerR family transcriptional regulator [unclassified Psychrobacter]
MNIKELTETVGLSRDTIRFYEREGLISTPSRKSNGYRDYDNEIVEQLNMIVMVKELGFTLKEIRELTELLYPNSLTQSQMGEKLIEKNRQIEIKISELFEMKTLIDDALKGMCEYKDKVTL